VLPFFIFLPRRPRFCAAAGFIALQVLIFSTGNYCYFNLLTIALCVLLLDDTTLMPWIPARWRGKAGDRVQGSGFAGKPLEPDGRGRLGWWFRLLATVPLAGLIAAISLSQLWAMFHRGFDWPRALIKLHQWVGPLRSFNSYGLFAAMTRPRYEIVVEGSDDGQVWYEYEFKYKPGDVKRRPVFVAPHQPRLDWQMWFAALGSVQQNRWFVEFCVRLLQGTPEVVALLERNPFPKAPPRYIRARLYEYHFTTFGERRKTGAWWRRELKGAYMPAISLRQ
jgi:hypothetical protein